MKYFKLFIILYFLSNILLAQVCCSLVGAVNTGSNGLISAHFPSKLDFQRHNRWNVVANFNQPFSGDLNIKYGLSTNIQAEFSGYIFEETIGFVNSAFSFVQIDETLSFDKTSTNILLSTFKTGLRHNLSDRLGFITGSVSIPLNPKYSNDDFFFLTETVPSAAVSWQKSIGKNPKFQLATSYEKNFKEKDNVFLDDRFNISLSTNKSILGLIFLPFSNIEYQKLISPLSPYDTDRQNRWLGVVTAGANIVPLHEKWDWLQLTIRIPIYNWASEVGFPDGTQPITTVSISINKNGVFNSGGNSINIFE